MRQTGTIGRRKMAFRLSNAAMTTPETLLYVEAVLMLPLFLLGVSHIVQRQMWTDFFIGLAQKGHAGVVWRTFMLELWPAVLIVMFHQDWRWPGILITVYGHLLMVKVALSLLVPSLGLKSLQQADRHGSWAFLPAGLVLIALSAVCAVRVIPAYL
ncbi:MAG: hypothetical protein AAGI14_09355 [Pseudomonadota bacterium]